MKELDIEAEKLKYQRAIRDIAKRYGVRKLARDFDIPRGTLNTMFYGRGKCKLDTYAKIYNTVKNA